MADNEATYIFHGDLQKLRDQSSKEKSSRIMNEANVLRVTKISYGNAQKIE